MRYGVTSNASPTECESPKFVFSHLKLAMHPSSPKKLITGFITKKLGDNTEKKSASPGKTLRRKIKYTYHLSRKIEQWKHPQKWNHKMISTYSKQTSSKFVICEGETIE